MSEGAKTENPANEERAAEANQNSSIEELRSLNDRLYAEAKSLRAESKDRRLKLESIERTNQEREDAELGELDKTKKQLERVTTEFDSFKTSATQKDLSTRFVQAVTEAGLPPKIAKVAMPSNLSEDNMKDSVKGAVKEFKEFIKSEDKPEPSAASSLASIQPAQPGETPRKYEYPGQFTAREAVNNLLKDIK